MKFGPLPLVILLGCAPLPVRKPSSYPPAIVGEVSMEKSYYQVFPSVKEDGSLKHYLYLQLRDSHARYVDQEFPAIIVKNKKGEKIPFSLEKIMPGRYYVTMKGTFQKDLSILVGGKKLPGQINLTYDRPDRAHSSITLVEEKESELVLQLRLADKNNRPIKTTNTPEIILEGMGQISELRPIQEGIWEFSLTYPEINQLIYLSVRAQDAYFSNIYRRQQIEK